VATRAVIFGCAGLRLSGEERRFFARCDPLGFVLFARNVEAPGQIRSLVAELREAVGRKDAPVVIDQEGGRVQRLRPPYWRAAPPAARFGELALADRDGALEAVSLNGRLIGAELAQLGIDTVCAPVLDLRHPGAHEVIGDRSFASDPDIVAALGRAACEGFRESGVAPIIKHMPGHGRAKVDSHRALPVVDASLAELEATDFRPFRALAEEPLGMTGHLVLQAVDPENPATTSPRVIAEVIRGRIGFQGVLMTDDLSMGALRGSIGRRALAALEAGCDIALHCNGRMEEMLEVADAVSPISNAATAGWAVARERAARVATAAEQMDSAVLARRLDDLLERTPSA
jgi:beta-N-acetylhexosaminidase